MYRKIRKIEGSERDKERRKREITKEYVRKLRGRN